MNPSRAVRAVAISIAVTSIVACRGTEERGSSGQASSPSSSRQALAATGPPALPDLTRLAPPLQERLKNQYASLEAAATSASPAPQLGEAYGAMGRLLLAAEYTDAADPFFANAQALMPDDYRWPYHRGHVARLAHRLPDAASHFRQVLELRPDHVPSMIWLADVRLAEGQPVAAELYLEKAVALQPQSAAAWFRRGRARLARGDIPNAIADLERARSTLAASGFSGSPKPLRAGGGSRTSLQPQADAIGYQLGIAYRSAGDLRKAEPFLRRPADAASVVPEDPLIDSLSGLLQDSGAFYVVRGLQAMEERRWEAAVADLRTASELSPRDGTIQLNLGTALFLSGDAAGARAAVEAAIRLDPGLPRAHYVLGLILETERRDGEAIDRFSKAVDLDPGYIEALASLGDALRRTGRVELSLERYRRVLELNPAASQARFGYGMGLVRLGRYRNAADWFVEASQLHPDQPGFAHAHARLLAAAPDIQARDGRRALVIVEELVAKERSAPVLETMAMALAEVGRYDEAVKRQQEAIEATRGAGRQVPASMRENLARYERREPCRMPWAPDDPVHRPGAS